MSQSSSQPPLSTTTGATIDTEKPQTTNQLLVADQTNNPIVEILAKIMVELRVMNKLIQSEQKVQIDLDVMRTDVIQENNLTIPNPI